MEGTNVWTNDWIDELEKSKKSCNKKFRAVTKRERELIAKLDRLRSESTKDLLEDATEVEDTKSPSCHPKFPEKVANASKGSFQ